MSNQFAFPTTEHSTLPDEIAPLNPQDLQDIFVQFPPDTSLPPLYPVCEDPPVEWHPDFGQLETVNVFSSDAFPGEKVNDTIGARLDLTKKDALPTPVTLVSFPPQPAILATATTVTTDCNNLRGQLAAVQAERDNLKAQVELLKAEKATLLATQIKQEDPQVQLAELSCVVRSPSSRSSSTASPQPTTSAKKRPNPSLDLWPTHYTDTPVSANTHPDLFENALIQEHPNISVKMFKAVFNSITKLCTRKIKTKEQFWQAYSSQCNQLAHFIPDTRLTCDPSERPMSVVVSAERFVAGNWMPDRDCTEEREFPVDDKGHVELYHFCFGNARDARKTQFRLRIAFGETEVFTRGFYIGCASSVSHFKSSLNKRQRK